MSSSRKKTTYLPQFLITLNQTLLENSLILSPLYFHCRQVYIGSHTGQHPEAVGLLEGQVPEDLLPAQEREVLHLRQLLGYWWQVDRVGQ